MENDLQRIGLTELQSRTYLYLLKFPTGRKPAKIAADLGITRTNCYKVLEQLEDHDLVRRSEIGKTYTYFAEDPIALTTLVSRARNETIALEKHVKAAMGELQKQYLRGGKHTDIRGAYGKVAMLQAYRTHYKPGHDVHFIKSRADIPFMGYETMDAMRKAGRKHSVQRHGITPDVAEAPNDPAIDARNNLRRTWIPAGSYTSPVEWTVSGNELVIMSFTGNGSVIKIKDEVIADSFRQIWHLMDSSLRQSPGYRKLPLKAGRKI
jgi:predicted transcriptional regulator